MATLEHDRTRKYQFWTPERWDDGKFDGDGRFIVYRPDVPRSITITGRPGYAYRYRVVWWLNTGVWPGEGLCVHHINGNHQDDRFENLQLLSNSEHMKIHARDERKKYPEKKCPVCNRVFRNKRRPTTTTFCSRACYHKARWGETHIRKPFVCQWCGKEFVGKDCYRDYRFCGGSCVQKHRWATMPDSFRGERKRGSK